MGDSRFTEEEKKYRIELLTDDTKTDSEIAIAIGISTDYVRILRRRWGLSQKKKGRKPGTMISKYSTTCKVCGSEFDTIPSDTDRMYCSKECMGKCPEYRKKLSEIDKSYMGTDAYRQTRIDPTVSEYRRYANRVRKLSEETYNLHESEINPHKHIRGLAGTPNAYHLDHKISVRYGFDNGIPPEVLAKKENLRILPWRVNIVKGK